MEAKDEGTCKGLFQQIPSKCLSLLKNKHILQKLVAENSLDFLLFLITVMAEIKIDEKVFMELLEQEHPETGNNILFQMMDTLKPSEIDGWEKLFQNIEYHFGPPFLRRLLKIKHPKMGNTIFHCAIEKKNEKLCQILVSRGRSELLIIKDANGNTPLHNLIWRSLTSVLEKALQIIGEENSIDILNRQLNKVGESTVHVAAQLGYNHILEHLLAYGAKLDSINRNHYSPLHVAALNGNCLCVEIILISVEREKLRQYVNMTTKFGCTAFMLAAENGYSGVCDLLADQTDLSNEDKTGNNAFHYAVRKGSESIIKILLGYISKTGKIHTTEDSILTKCLLKKNKDGFTPLLLAARKNKPECLRLLITRRILNKNERIELFRCLIKHKSNDCVDLLLKNPIDCVEYGSNSSDNIPSIFLDILDSTLDKRKDSALDEGKDSALDEGKDSALDKGKDSALDKGKDSALDEGKDSALDKGKDSALDKGKDSALDKGKDSALDKGKDSALDKGKDSALDKGKDSALDKGKDSALDKGNTFLHLAIVHKSYNMALKILKENDKLKLVVNNMGEYPLHLAAMIPDEEFKKAHRKTIEKLLDKLVEGAREISNRKTLTGDSYLHLCAKYGNSYLIDLLVKRRSNLTLTNGSNLTAFEIAVNESKSDVLRELLKHVTESVQRKCLENFKRCICVASGKGDKIAIELVLAHLEVSKEDK